MQKLMWPKSFICVPDKYEQHQKKNPVEIFAQRR